MKHHDEIDDRIGGALALLAEIEARAEAALAMLHAAADEKDADGKLTKAALDARQRLRNPEGNVSRISVVVKEMARTDKGAKRIRLSESAAEAKTAAAMAVSKAVEAEIALKAFDEKRDTYLALSGSRKRSPEQLVDAHEGRTFMNKLVERGSPVSILDQLSADEMDFFHALLVDKAQDPAHRKSDGAWHAMMRAGFIDFKAECMSEDERNAVLIATSDIEQHHFEAMQALETVAGRKLDLSPSLAIALYVVFASPDLRPGVDRLRMAAKSIQFDADIDKLIRLLGLEPKDWVRMTEIMNPTMVRLREEQYTRPSLPEPEDLPDKWPAAVSDAPTAKMDDMTPLQLPLTDQQAHIIERKVYASDPTHQVWAPAASPVAPVVPVVPSDVVMSISGGEGFSEDEAQKLAELLFYEFKGATNPLWDGTGLAVGVMDRAVLLPALRVAVLYSGYSKQKEFLAAVERGDHEQFVAQYKAPHVQRLKEGLMAGSPKYLERARERGLLP